MATVMQRQPYDQPTANYAVRVRRTLDELVAWRLAELRRNGIRCSKVELTEMLLWEIADIDVAELSARLKALPPARLALASQPRAEALPMPLSTVSAVLPREGLGKRSRLTPRHVLRRVLHGTG
jgi:hypothetical protein